MHEATELILPAEMRTRIESLARVVAQSPQDWIEETLMLQIAQSERRQQLLEHAMRAAAAIDAGEALYAMDAVHDYLLARAAGQPGKRPHPKHLVVAKKHADLTGGE